MMLTDLNNIPADFTQETSLNGKYLKGIETAVTDPDADIGNANHTHDSDGDHLHPATVPSHTHSGTHGGASTFNALGQTQFGSSPSHTHSMSSSSAAVAETISDGAHTHDAFTNDLEHRTITFYKKTNTVINMSRKSLPRKMTFFYSKTGTLPEGLLENLLYDGKHFKGDATPNTESGSNTHQHDNVTHNHPTDISDHEHTFNFGGAGASGPSTSGGNAGNVVASISHSHSSNSAATTGKSSTPVTSGNDSGHQHDNITHEPSYKTLRLMEVNVVQMNQVGVPKNCILLWLDTITLLNLVSGWQVSDGTNDTTNLLAKFPKGSSTPLTEAGSDTHTHSEDTVSHSHSSADVEHTHSPTGSSAAASAATINSGGGQAGATSGHAHSVSSVVAQAAQTVTITNGPSDHDHGSISNDPDSKTVAFIERVT